MADAFARFRLDGRVAVVTGAASGIGFASAQALGRAGARIAVADINAERAEKAVASLKGEGIEAVAHVFDVADETRVVAVMAEVARAWGRLDILINNAGLAARQPSEALDLATWEKVLRINLNGSFLCAREAGKVMLAQGRGSVVNIASIMGLVGGGLYPNLAYHSTKGALVNFTRALAVEWAGRGVRVNAVAPTFVRTPLTARLLSDAQMKAAIEGMTPLGRLAEADEIADAVLYLASDAAAMVTGHTLPVDGGWVAR
ncbi:MAG: SDR family oxidoreductase [Alphaproteobacteria bacterium]|nr:SDR family oxidoreductase [Alphaproteobacteria bacterium]